MQLQKALNSSRTGTEAGQGNKTRGASCDVLPERTQSRRQREVHILPKTLAATVLDQAAALPSCSLCSLHRVFESRAGAAAPAWSLCRGAQDSQHLRRRCVV